MIYILYNKLDDFSNFLMFPILKVYLQKEKDGVHPILIHCVYFCANASTARRIFCGTPFIRI